MHIRWFLSLSASRCHSLSGSPNHLVPSNPCTSTHTHTHIHAHTHQAWACSKPVVVTQKGGPGELVHNGKDGIKV